MVTCSRCAEESQNPSECLGETLCTACARAFHEWVTAGVAQPGKRAEYGQRHAQVMHLIAKHGYATAPLLAELTGLHRTACSWYLHQRAKKGVLEFQGRGWFVLAQRKVAA